MLSSSPSCVQRLQQPADGRVGHLDRPVESGQILTDLRPVGQVRRNVETLGIGGDIPVDRVRAVRLEEAGGQQERLRREPRQPPRRPIGDVFAVRIRHVVLVEAEPLGIRGLVLHPEQGRVPARLRQQGRQRADVVVVLPAVVCEADQPVAVRVPAREQGATRRRAQRRRRMRVRQQHTLRGEPVEVRTTYPGRAVTPEVTAQIVPVHDQNVVTDGIHRGRHSRLLHRRGVTGRPELRPPGVREPAWPGRRRSRLPAGPAPRCRRG